MRMGRVSRCASCGAQNEPGALFCTTCNHFLAWDEGPPAPRGRPVAAAAPVPEPEPAPEPEPPAGAAAGAAAHGRSRPARTPRPSPPRTALEPASGVHDAHLGPTRDRLQHRPVPVVVLGKFKQGKSTLVNALLQSAVCPVDADVVTAVPTLIRCAPEPRVTTFVVDDGGARGQELDMPLDSLAGLVTEEADPDQPLRQRSVEVGLPHRMLRSGPVLVDTPGVGGLDSAHGFLTLGALRQAEGVLFVSDASSELSGPELEFLRTAVQRCERIALVLTKVDLHPQWRRIAELDRGHLERAGL